MIRELVIAAAVSGAALAVAPAAVADQQRYNGDVPGMNYDASLGAPCDNYERFIFGRGPDGQAEACHFITHQFPTAETGYWVISYPLYGVHNPGEPCASYADPRGSAAQTPDGLPLTCTQAQGWVVGSLTGGGFPIVGGGFPSDTSVRD
ncbi:hypothetical protein [Mycobacterium noviomagense]|uniref:Secreted protein n=1 Tax=Mycobacterium noviomagense TaxID=459858 RepID=A0A7I7PJU6_9MYCO|nr:hypothetical protein [Mycobacterium noviomagense]ORB16347.1 hypothetical protein BST37_07355 [Mycobacterium noviomagense]BBY08836.1 hypothetical protein MNVI_41540 [Mycobacterium noviomagense]